MLDESFILQYLSEVLEDMSDRKRAVFEGSLKKYAISTTLLRIERVVQFHFYQDHFLEAVARWPWLLCSNLGAHLEPCYDEEKMKYKLGFTGWKGIYGQNP